MIKKIRIFHFLEYSGQVIQKFFKWKSIKEDMTAGK